MDTREAFRQCMDMADMVCLGYLNDMTDEELLKRPCPGCNHINWQLGHLIASEHDMMTGIGAEMPPLPPGFTDKYSKETAAVDDPAAFCGKEELIGAFKTQRAGTLAALEKTTDADFDKASGRDYAPTIGAIFSLQGSHWLMHCGQWAVVRRQLGRPPLF